MYETQFFSCFVYVIYTDLLLVYLDPLDVEECSIIIKSIKQLILLILVYLFCFIWCFCLLDCDSTFISLLLHNFTIDWGLNISVSVCSLQSYRSAFIFVQFYLIIGLCISVYFCFILHFFTGLWVSI